MNATKPTMSVLIVAVCTLALGGCGASNDSSDAPAPVVIVKHSDAARPQPGFADGQDGRTRPCPIYQHCPQ